MGELVASSHQALFTLKELDNYAGLRRDAGYWGVPPGPAGAVPHWPEGEGKRIFVYGQPFPGLPQMLEDLDKSGHRSLVYISKLSQEERQRLESTHMHYADRLLDMTAVSRECDCAVMTNGHGTTTAMLLAGKPVLILPQHLEMLLIGMSVHDQGVGLVAPALNPEGIRTKLGRILSEESFSVAARTVAERYRGQAEPADAQRHFQTLIARLAAEAA